MFSVFKKKPEPVRFRRVPHDVVEFGGLIARMWDNNDTSGKRFVGFSLHKMAQVKGEGRRPVNNFAVDDVTSLVGLCQSLCEWYARDKSTPEASVRELDSFNTIPFRVSHLRSGQKQKSLWV